MGCERNDRHSVRSTSGIYWISAHGSIGVNNPSLLLSLHQRQSKNRHFFPSLIISWRISTAPSLFVTEIQSYKPRTYLAHSGACLRCLSRKVIGVVFALRLVPNFSYYCGLVFPEKSPSRGGLENAKSTILGSADHRGRRPVQTIDRNKWQNRDMMCPYQHLLHFMTLIHVQPLILVGDLCTGGGGGLRPPVWARLCLTLHPCSEY